MADNTVSQVTPIVNENRPIRVEFIGENTPAVRSDVLAAHFHRSHKNVLRDIAKLRSKCPDSFFGLNFEPIAIDVKTGFGIRKDPAYLLTRDGFSLLVMGFAGAEAVRWKLKYIEAFNALEAAVLENRAELARQAGYAQGLDEARALPAARKLRAEAAEAVLTLHPKRLDTLKKALRYAKLGLSSRDIAKLLDANHRQVGHLLSLARKNGLLAEVWQNETD